MGVVEPPSLDDGPQPQEPVIKAGTIGTFVTSTLVLLVAFRVPLTHTQQLAVIGFVAGATPIVMALWHRRQVFSPESVRLLLRSERDKRDRV